MNNNIGTGVRPDLSRGMQDLLTAMPKEYSKRILMNNNIGTGVRPDLSRGMQDLLTTIPKEYSKRILMNIKCKDQMDRTICSICTLRYPHMLM